MRFGFWRYQNVGCQVSEKGLPTNGEKQALKSRVYKRKCTCMGRRCFCGWTWPGWPGSCCPGQSFYESGQAGVQSTKGSNKRNGACMGRRLRFGFWRYQNVGCQASEKGLPTNGEKQALKSRVYKRKCTCRGRRLFCVWSWPGSPGSCCPGQRLYESGQAGVQSTKGSNNIIVCVRGTAVDCWLLAVPKRRMPGQ